MSSDTKKKIYITVNRDTVQVLRDGKYRLCLLKEIEFNGELSQGTVIFATISAEELSINMQLEWQESYQVFETEQNIIAGEPIKYGTATPDAQPKEKITFHEDGTYERQHQSNDTRTVVNQWRGHARVGVRCYDPNGAEDEKFVPFYLSPVRAYQAASDLTPVDSFSLFFSSDVNYKAGTIVDLSRVPISNSRFRLKEGHVAGKVFYDDHKEKEKYWEADNEGIEKLL